MTPDDLKRAGVRVRKLVWKDVLNPREDGPALGRDVLTALIQNREEKRKWQRDIDFRPCRFVRFACVNVS